MSPTSFHCWLTAFVLTLALTGSSTVADELGISKEKPAYGRYVRTDRGYMVSYQDTIPGTDVVFEMVPVAGGSIKLFADKSGKSDSIEVAIDPFWIGKYEVTWAEFDQYRQLLTSFKQFERRGVRRVTNHNSIDAVTAPSEWYLPRTPTSGDESEWPAHPAVSMTQYGAKQYTKWLSKLTGQFYRLPSNAEWEYACRAGSSTAFSFGDQEDKLGDYAWYYENSSEDTHPVGLKKPNPWGLFDMHGNASEWVLDQYSEGYEQLKKRQSKSTAILWPTRLYPRTVRGGSWDSDARECRSTSRVGSNKEWQNEEPQIPTSPHWLTSAMQRQIGFRIARPLDTPPTKLHSKYWDADIDELKEAVEIYYSNGHSARGVVDSKLPQAIKQLEEAAGKGRRRKEK